MKKHRIDILLMTGGHGGFENIVNRSSAFLTSRGYDIRYVQMIRTEADWQHPSVRKAFLEMDGNDFDFDDARQRYAALLDGDHEKPDLILATGWPYTIYVAKGASSDASLPVPVVAWLHGDLKFYEEGGCGGTDMLAFADMCLAISNPIADAAYNAYPEKPLYRIRNGFDESAVRYSEERDTLRLACVGRLSEEKALPILLYALEKTKRPWELSFVGEGAMEEELRTLCDNLHLKNRVRFFGWQERPWDQLTDCRALLLSSLYEGAPLNVVEALACGMQVISTPAGNVPEIIGDAPCCTIVPFADPDALTKALDRMGATHFTAQTARDCRALVQEYLPEPTLFDFMMKVDACARCVLLPENYIPGKTDLYIRSSDTDA